jgi:hypothetical protein
VDGTRDLTLPDNVRVYFLAGAQHIPGPFPPIRASSPAANANAGPQMRLDGQELSNPVPQHHIARALLRALHAWVRHDVAPPPSRYPRLGDNTLVPVAQVAFPALAGVADPRRIVGPARVINGKRTPLPYLVPQVDRDGNDLAGIHDPEAAVPLATTTGWNFRRDAIGNPRDIYQTLGSYIPLAVTRAAREAAGDPRPAIEERYRNREDYLERVRASAADLIRQRFMLAEDLDRVVARAARHWDFATGHSRGVRAEGR